MPIDYRYDPERDAVYGTLTSPLTTDEINETIRRLIADSRFPPDTRTLWDLRRLDFARLDPITRRRLTATRDRFSSRDTARVAYVVTSELGYGMTRMYEIQAGVEPELNRVFRDFDEAERWLLAEK